MTITHSYPVSRPPHAVMLMAPIRSITDGTGGEKEQIWSRRVESGGYEVCCIPFFLYNLALGDIVESSEQMNWNIGSVLNRSGNNTLRIAIKPSDAFDTVHEILHSIIAKREYYVEWLNHGYAAVNLPAHENYDGLIEELSDRLPESIEIELAYDEGLRFPMTSAS